MIAGKIDRLTHLAKIDQLSRIVPLALRIVYGTLVPCETKQRSCRMTLQSHLAELERRHKAIDRQVEEEKLHPACDTLKLAELKRKKLQIKDEIARLQHDGPTLH
jgi:hypothetical protein